MLEDADFFEVFQILDDESARNGTVLGRHSVANLLRVAVAVREIENFVGIFFATAPDALIVENFRRG